MICLQNKVLLIFFILDMTCSIWKTTWSTLLLENFYLFIYQKLPELIYFPQ